MQAESRMLYKLIILYLLDKIDFPITNIQLSNFLLEKEYTTYFNIQETFQDLLDDEYIRSDKINNNYAYCITAQGHEALLFFSNTLSPTIKDEIDAYIQQNEYTLREESSIIADYYEIKKDEYLTRLQVFERGTCIFDLSLNLSSKESAEQICKNWRIKSSDIYAYILMNLMSDE